MMNLLAFFVDRIANCAGQVAGLALQVKSSLGAYAQGPLSHAIRAQAVSMVNRLAEACDGDMPSQSAELRCLASSD